MTDILTVTELNLEVKGILAKHYSKKLNVEGEMSNFKVHGTTAFFVLKDDESKIDCMFFNYTGQNIINGKQVKVIGTLTAKAGIYKIIVKQIELMGIGKLHQEYTILKERYEKLGYFSDNRKKPMKNIINTIGVITSQDGAALQDFIYALSKNNYTGKVLIKHSVVQGKDCPMSIVNSLQEMDKLNLDIIVVTRGGGSFEDLFGFSDCNVIETLFNMKTTTMSAIGHQIDFMLSDFVADIRAPTPTSAAELLSCKKENVFSLNEVIEMETILKDKIRGYIDNYNNELITITNTLTPIDKIMDNITHDIEKMCNVLSYKIQNKLLLYSNQLNDIVIAPCENYVILDNNKNIINKIEQFDNIKTKDKLTIKFAKGYATFNVSNIKVCK
jgi:exodeoxyribonuclease VII large subunit